MLYMVVNMHISLYLLFVSITCLKDYSETTVYNFCVTVFFKLFLPPQFVKQVSTSCCTK